MLEKLSKCEPFNQKFLKIPGGKENETEFLRNRLSFFPDISENINQFATRNFQKSSVKCFVEWEAQINPGCSSKDHLTSQCYKIVLKPFSHDIALHARPLKMYLKTRRQGKKETTSEAIPKIPNISWKKSLFYLISFSECLARWVEF